MPRSHIGTFYDPRASHLRLDCKPAAKKTEFIDNKLVPSIMLGVGACALIASIPTIIFFLPVGLALLGIALLFLSAAPALLVSDDENSSEKALSL